MRIISIENEISSEDRWSYITCDPEEHSGSWPPATLRQVGRVYPEGSRLVVSLRLFR
jgi:hypothetical protein